MEGKVSGILSSCDTARAANHSEVPCEVALVLQMWPAALF